MTYAGQPAKAVEVLRSNTRLDPFQSPVWLAFMGHAYYMLENYDDAIRSLRECAARMPNSQLPHIGLAASYAQLKRLTEAKVEAEEILRINPGFPIEKFKGLAVYKERRTSNIAWRVYVRRAWPRPTRANRPAGWASDKPIVSPSNNVLSWH